MRARHLLFGLLSLTAATNVALAETQVVCSISGCQKIEFEVPAFAGAQNLTVSQVWRHASEILAVSGLEPNFQVVESDDIGEAAAIVHRNERFIIVNPEWIGELANNPKAKWQIYGVLAHEIGHHLQGHTLLGIGSRPPVELQADSYAGFALGALGASKEEALSLWQSFGEKGSATHPPRHQRLAAVERGWLRAAQRLGATQAPPIEEAEKPPLPQPSKSLERDRSRDVSCQPVNTSVGQAVSCVTSVLNAGQESAQSPALLFDEDTETSWVEDSARFGAGQTIAIDFLQPVDIRRVLFHSGLAPNATASSQSPRVQRLEVKTSSGFIGQITLEDSLEWQFVSLPLGAAEWISFTIEQSYPGNGPQDLAIAEIGFE